MPPPPPISESAIVLLCVSFVACDAPGHKLKLTLCGNKYPERNRQTVIITLLQVSKPGCITLNVRIFSECPGHCIYFACPFSI